MNAILHRMYGRLGIRRLSAREITMSLPKHLRTKETENNINTAIAGIDALLSEGVIMVYRDKTILDNERFLFFNHITIYEDGEVRFYDWHDIANSRNTTIFHLDKLRARAIKRRFDSLYYNASPITDINK